MCRPIRGSVPGGQSVFDCYQSAQCASLKVLAVSFEIMWDFSGVGVTATDYLDVLHLVWFSLYYTDPNVILHVSQEED